MIPLRLVAISVLVSLSLAENVVTQTQEPVQSSLSATQTVLTIAPPNTPSTLIPFQVAVEGRTGELFDVVSANSAAVVTLILPNGTEIDSSNAAAFGYTYGVVEETSPAITDPMLITPFSLPGTHTFIQLPTTAPTGTYQIKINTFGVATEVEIAASYITGSRVRVALRTNKDSYTVGESVILSALIFDGSSAVTNATIQAAVMDLDHPEVDPVQVTMQDSGANDAATGDGIYTGVFSATSGGRFMAGARITGTSQSGAAYTRTTGREFRVLQPLASFVSFSDSGVDDNGNSLIDRIVVTANVQIQTAGNYRLELSLAASNGSETRATAGANLAAGAQQLQTAFPAKQISNLGVNGPYTIKNATLVYTNDSEEPVAAFTANGGQTAAYLLSSLERPVVKFTGNNTATGIDTNSNGKYDVLRIQVEVNTLTAATYNWSGTLKDSAGRNIQAIDGASNMSTGNNTLTFNFNGVKIAQHGVDGPYTLGSVLVFNEQVSAHEAALFKTQAFSVNQFECSDAPAATVQSAGLTPASVVGGNATTLHVTLAEAAGACGAKLTISSDNPAVIAAAIPATVIVPAGQTSADFAVITAGVATTTQVNLTATSGASSQNALLTLTPSSLTNLTLVPAAVQAGENTTATVALDGVAPQGGRSVSLLSGNTSIATVPATVVIPAQQRSVQFTVNTNPAFEGNTSVNISGTLGAVTKNAPLTIFSEEFINGSITPGGAAVTVTATQPGQNFRLTFDGNASQRISLRLTDVSIGTSTCCGAYVSIKKPDGSYLITPTFVGTAGGFLDAATLPVTGSYTVVVDPIGSNSGSMTLTLYDVPADATGTITPGGAAVTTSVTVPGQNGRLTFAGTMGQRVSLKVSGVTLSGGSGYAGIFINKPDGSNLTSVSFIPASGMFIDVQTLPTTGTYTILVDPHDTGIGSVTLTLYDVPADVTGNLTVGTPLTATMNVPGQNAALSFNGTAGQRITANIGSVTLTGGSGYVDVTVKNPDGTTLTFSNFVTSGGAFINTQTLPTTGVYTFVINPQDLNTGSVTLTVNDVTADLTSTIVSGGSAVTVTTTSAGQNALVSFDGTAGQRISLKISGVSLSGGNGYVDVYIKRPDGTTLTSSLFVTSSGGFIDATTLPVTGTYTILVDPQGTNIGSVTLTLYNVPADATGSITSGGSAVTVTTTTPGQNAQLTFSGTVDQRVSLLITNSTYAGCLAVTNSIKKPDGTTLFSQNMCSASDFIDVVTLPVSGTYTILIDPQGANTGTATLLLGDVPADSSTSITPGGPPVTLTITAAGQKALATFSGTANQRISLKVTDVTMTGGFNNNWTSIAIKKPDGSTLTSTLFSNAGGFIDVQTLPVTGTYTILVDPWDITTGSVTLTLYDVPADDSASILPGSPPVTLTNTTPGQNGQATFTATANQRVSLSINSVSLSGGSLNWAVVTVKAPDGSTLAVNSFSTGGTGFIDTLVLTSAGTYTILVNPMDMATGTVNFTLHDVPADAGGTITIGGSSLTVTTTVPGQNAAPIFSGTSGQQVSVAFTNNGLSTVTVALLKPDGTSLTSSTTNAASFTLPTSTLPTTGTYSIKIDPSGAIVGSITVAVTEISSSATLMADYQFQNTRDSSVGTPPALADLGTNSFTSATVDGTSRTVLSFSQNNGLSLSSTSGVVPNGTYTIVMLCSIQQTSSYRRLIDFKNATSDTGLYQQNGHLFLYPIGFGNPVSIAANTWVQIVITRDSTGTLTGYVDGVQQFQVSDTGGYGVISNDTLRFFRDDGSSSEASAGSVARIRLYDGALSASQVSALSRLP